MISRRVRDVGISWVAVTALVAATDLIFRQSLSQEYVSTFGNSHLLLKLMAFSFKALHDEIFIRLGLVTFIMFSAAAVSRKSVFLLSPAVGATAIILAQAINLWSLGVSPYIFLRFFLPGVVWGYLYLRHGIFASIAGHCGCYLLLLPTLYLILN